MNQKQQQDCWLYFWQDQRVRKYIAAQVKEASLSFYKTTTHDVYFTYLLQIDNQELEINEISVIVGLGKGFPLAPPQIYLATSFTKPSIKDHRDILAELIGQSWQCEIRIAHILEKIPKFVSKLVDLRGKSSTIQKIGDFHAHKYYDYSLMKELSLHNPFVCFETIEDRISILVISITSTHIIFFQPTQQPYFNEENKLIIPREADLSSMRIIFIAEMQSLADITHDRTNKNQFALRFVAFQMRKMEFTKQEWRKSLSITRSSRFMECLIKEMWHFGMQINLEIGSIKANSQQELLLIEASKREQKLKHYFNRESLLELVDAYQKLVQYYSAEGPPYQQIYVHKTIFLYNRPDVELILKAHSPK